MTNYDIDQCELEELEIIKPDYQQIWNDQDYDWPDERVEPCIKQEFDGSEIEITPGIIVYHCDCYGNDNGEAVFYSLEESPFLQGDGFSDWEELLGEYCLERHNEHIETIEKRLNPGRYYGAPHRSVK